MKNLYLILSIALTSAVLVVHNVVDVELPHLIMGILLAIPLFILPYRQYICYLFFTIPITFGVHGIYTILLAGSLILRLKNKTTSQYLIILIFLFLEITSMAFGYVGQVQIVEIVMYISNITVFILTLFYISDEESYSNCIRYYCYGMGLTLTVLYLRAFLVSDMLTDDILSGQMRSGVTMGNDGDVVKTSTYIEANANTVAFYAITLYSTLLVGISRLGINKVVYTLLIVISIAAGIMSFSRTWLMLALSLTTIYFLSSKGKNKLAFLLVLVPLVLVILSSNQILNSVSDAYTTRFEESSFQTAGGRTLLFDEYNNFLFNNPQYIPIGTGVINYKEICMCSNSIHCGLQQIYICQGLVGVLLFVLICAMFAQRCVKSKIKFVQCLPLLSVFIFNQTIQMLNPYALILPFVCAAYVLKLDYKKS